MPSTQESVTREDNERLDISMNARRAARMGQTEGASHSAKMHSLARRSLGASELNA